MPISFSSALEEQGVPRRDTRAASAFGGFLQMHGDVERRFPRHKHRRRSGMGAVEDRQVALARKDFFHVLRARRSIACSDCGIGLAGTVKVRNVKQNWIRKRIEDRQQPLKRRERTHVNEDFLAAAGRPLRRITEPLGEDAPVLLVSGEG